MTDSLFENLANAWVRRDESARNPHLKFRALVRLDKQIDKLLVKVLTNADDHWSGFNHRLGPDNPGVVFALAVIAFEFCDTEKINRIVEVATSSKRAFRGAISALGWLSGNSFRRVIVDLVGAKTWQHRSLGIAACGARRVNPRAYLNKAVDSSNLFLKIRALKAAGQLKRDDMLPVLQEHLKDTEPGCRFEASRSAVLLGDKAALQTLGGFILSRSPQLAAAMDVALRVVDGQTALEWLKTLSRAPEFRPQMLRGIAIVGNPAYIPILIKQMKAGQLQRRAGDAFTAITGVDLITNDLFIESPAVNIDQESSQDKCLALPDPERVSAWWDENNEAFPPGSRYLTGVPMSEESCKRLLRTGNQRTRKAAALELALAHVDARYFNTRARAKWQQKRLFKS